MKRVLLIGLLLALLSASQGFAQSFQDRVVLHRGYFLGMHDTQRSAITYRGSNGNDSATVIGAQRRNWQFGLNWGTSVLLYALDDENSIRLSASLAGSIFATAGAFTIDGELIDNDLGFALQIPVVLNYHFGHFATKNSLRDNGFNVGLGIEINRISSAANTFQENYQNFYTGNGRVIGNESNIIQPVLSLGYYYWNSSDLVRSLNLQIGFGARQELAGTEYYRPSVRLSLHRYIKY